MVRLPYKMGVFGQKGRIQVYSSQRKDKFTVKVYTEGGGGRLGKLQCRSNKKGKLIIQFYLVYMRGDSFGPILAHIRPFDP